MGTAPTRDTIFGRRSLPHTIVIARGETVRHWTVRPWVLATGTALAGLSILACVAATGLFLSSDRVAEAFRSREAAAVSAYERRIADLRNELDRVTTRSFVERDAVSREIRDLVAQQRELKARFERIGPLLRKAGEEGLLPDAVVPSPDRRAEAGVEPAVGHDVALLVSNLLPALRRSVDEMGEGQSSGLVALANDAQDKARKMADLLDRFGIDASNDPDKGVGGPFVEGGDGFTESLEQLDQALDLIDRLRRESAALPLARPIATVAQSSGFGIRTDPFLGRRAMHTGVDFPARTGTAVVAAAGGTVRSAGNADGYGLMVEIDHGNGVATRYGHLSRIDVAAGDVLQAGERLGAVGSTGRSTGPHLHYEVRRDDHPVNPQRYLDTGRRLAELS